jgi:glycerol-3-phosphate acyltransferase PlsY
VAVAIPLKTFGLHAPLVSFGIVAALLIIYMHRGNIARMLAGKEPRARRLWLLGIRRGES